MSQEWFINNTEEEQMPESRALNDQLICLRSKLNTNKVLDLGTDIGINLWDYDMGNNQLWIVEAVSESDEYKFKSVSSGTYLTDVGNDIPLELSNGGDSTSNWILEQGETEGFYVIVNSSTSRAIDVSGSFTTNGTPVISYARSGGDNQEWQLSVSQSSLQKDDIYRFDLHTNPVLPIFNEDKSLGVTSLTSEIYLTLSSINDIDSKNIKDVAFSEFITGRPLEDFGRLYGISEIKNEWLRPFHQGEQDTRTIIYHLTLGYRPNPGEALGLLRIPQIAVQVTFNDNSTIETWASSEDSLELSIPAFVFEHQLSVALHKEDSLEIVELQRKLAEQYDGKTVYIRSWMNDLTLDDSDTNDDLILFNLRQENNQKWTIHFRPETEDFYFTCVANNFNFYESDNIGLGNKVMTGSSVLVNGVEDSRARWRLLESGTMDDGTPLYKLKNRRSGNVLTFQSYVGNHSNPGTNSPLITNKDYGSKDLQQFRFTEV